MARVALQHGLGAITLTGVAAGLVFAIFEMVAAAMLMGAGAALMPLRMIGALVLGPAALDPGYSLAAAAMTGVIVHLVLSVTFTAVFTFIVSAISTATLGEVVATPGSIVLAGVLFGVALWLVNFYIVAPAAGWTWFPEQTNAGVQFFAHGFFFGAPTGWILTRLRRVVAAPV